MSERTPDNQPTGRPPSIASAIASLLDTMPGINAPASDRAAWFDAKAAVLQRIADHELTSTEDAVKAATMAGHARQAANTIREQEAQR